MKSKSFNGIKLCQQHKKKRQKLLAFLKNICPMMK